MKKVNDIAEQAEMEVNDERERAYKDALKNAFRKRAAAAQETSRCDAEYRALVDQGFEGWSDSHPFV